MDKLCKNDIETDDVEADCGPIKPVRPFHLEDISSEFPSKDIRFRSVESGYGSVNSIHSSLESGLTSDFEKLNLKPRSIEGPKKGDLYDKIDQESVKQKEESGFVVLEHEELLLEIFKPDKDGDSQLHMAIIQLLAPITMYFINLVPSFHWLNLPNNLLQVPLHLATITRQAVIVRKLMSAGADILARDYKGDSSLHIACREGFDDIVELLLSPIQYNETSEIRYQMERQQIPQDLQLMNYNGQSCLHLAAERSHLRILRLLLKSGANINIKDGKCGKTILHYAAETGNHVLLDFLLREGNLDLNALTYGGLSAVQLADGRCHKDVVSTLRSRGAVYAPLPVEENDSDEDMNE